METKTETSTAVMVIDKSQQPITLPSSIFLLFAEFLGYETPLIEWCEEACRKPNFPEYKKKIIDIDAINIFQKMRAEYGETKIHQYFVELYFVAIKEWVENYNKNNTVKIKLALDD